MQLYLNVDLKNCTVYCLYCSGIQSLLYVSEFKKN